MNTRLMHINIRTLTQRALGNDYTHLNDEKIDDSINLVIQDWIRKKVNNTEIQEGQSNSITEQYYEGLEPLIRTTRLTQLSKYPFNDYGKVADLNAIGKDSGVRYTAHGTLKSGSLYRILTFNTGDDFSNIGSDNQAGNIFTVKGAALYQPIDRSAGYVIRDSKGTYITDDRDLEAGVSYTVLEGSLTYALTDISEDGISVDGVTRIPNQNLITNLVIDKDSTFVIHNTLVPAVWTSSSVLENLDDSETMFKFISSTSTVNYSTGIKPANKSSRNRLFKSRSIDDYLNHARGTVISSPLSHMEGGKLIVYENRDNEAIPSNERFTIVDVVVRYYKKPNVVSLLRNIDCDLDEIDHPEIVRNTVELICAATTAQNHAGIANNNDKHTVN